MKGRERGVKGSKRSGGKETKKEAEGMEDRETDTGKRENGRGGREYS